MVKCWFWIIEVLRNEAIANNFMQSKELKLIETGWFRWIYSDVYSWDAYALQLSSNNQCGFFPGPSSVPTPRDRKNGVWDRRFFPVGTEAGPKFFFAVGTEAGPKFFFSRDQTGNTDRYWRDQLFFLFALHLNSWKLMLKNEKY